MRPVWAWGPLLLWVALMAVVSSIPHLRPPALLNGWDAVFHLIQFAGFGALLYRAFAHGGASAGRARIIVLIAAAAMIVVYEGHKLLIPGRHTSISDVVADLFGTLSGLGLVLIFRWRSEHVEIPGH